MRIRSGVNRVLQPARNRVETLMWEPHASRSAAGALLHLASRIYGRAVAIRLGGYASGRRPQRTLPCLVISVGNLTVGGTGKTPMTVYLARTLRELGCRPAVVSRGYGGRLQSTVAVAGDGRRPLLTADDVGDEPCMMANSLKGVPVIVGRNRHAAGLLALRTFAVDVILLDDAFQHLALARDLDIVMLNGHRPFGNGFLMPRGPLREPSAGLRRAGAVVFTQRFPVNTAENAVDGLLSGRIPSFVVERDPIVYKRAEPGAPSRDRQTLPNGLTPKPISWLCGRRVAAFSGIADNDRFRDGLRMLGCEIVSFSGFPDHHRYDSAELKGIADTASAGSADLVVTTEKDYARIAHRIPWTRSTAAVGIHLRFPQEQPFREFLLGSISRKIVISQGPPRE